MLLQSLKVTVHCYRENRLLKLLKVISSQLFVDSFLNIKALRCTFETKISL